MVAVSPRRLVTVPSRRTVLLERGPLAVLGWKAWRCEGRMRGVWRDMLLSFVLFEFIYVVCFCGFVRRGWMDA